jgi:hypothetical protein
VKALSAGKAVALYQEAGDPHALLSRTVLSTRLQEIRAWPQAPGGWDALVAVSDLWIPKFTLPTLVYRPPSLVVAVLCRSSCSSREIDSAFEHVCRIRGFSASSLAGVVTIRGEGAVQPLAEFANGRGVGLTTLSRKRVAREVGVEATVSLNRADALETAALLAAGQKGIPAMPEYRSDRFSLLIARQ